LLQTKVKLFQQIASVSPGVDLQRESVLEKQINDFLAGKDITLVDIKVSSNAAAVGDRITYYSLVALVLYQQAS